MLDSLRNRLLGSYLIVIGAVVFILAIALLAISASETARLLPELRQLGVIVQGARRELARLQEQGGALPDYERILIETADEQSVRILLVNISNRRVIFDSQIGDNNWVGKRLGDVLRPRGILANIDPNLPIGQIQAPDASRWLVYGQPLIARNQDRLWLLVGRPETGVLSYFREVFLRPLCLAGLVALVLAFVLSAIIGRSVTKPLGQMAGASEAMASGDYEQRVPITGPDEIKRVAGNFNAMASKVAASNQAQRDFVANVSHDLKTPLTSIRGWSQAILDGAARNFDQQRHAAGIIQDEADRMERMVSQLLILARIESGQLELNPEPVDAAHLLEDIRQRFDLIASERAIQLSVNSGERVFFTSDYDRLIQILSNLVDNALAVTESGGTVRLGAHLSRSNQVEIVVQDTGPGIPPADLERIFERFYQVDKSRADRDSRQGSGIGLSIVKELVDALDGRITIHSQVGMGTTFAIHLPAATAPQT